MYVLECTSHQPISTIQGGLERGRQRNLIETDPYQQGKSYCKNLALMTERSKILKYNALLFFLDMCCSAC